jgi:membrane protease YdiL (CAAX protease family)
MTASPARKKKTPQRGSSREPLIDQRFPVFLISLFRKEHRKPTIVMLYTTVAALVWKFFFDPEFLAERGLDAAFPSLPANAASAMTSMIACFVLFALVPMGIVQWGFRERLADYGWQVGIGKRTLGTFLMMAPVMLIAGYLASEDPAVARAYPINRGIDASTTVLLWHLFAYVLFYIGWEFLFRGFLQYGMVASSGVVPALLIQTMASAMLHLGKPGGELFLSIAAGVLWGFFAFFTRSILSGLLQHTVLGFALDLFLLRHSS